MQRGDIVEEQLTIRLPSDLARSLDAAASRLQRKRSEVVRIALVQFLEGAQPSTAPAERVRHLIGSLHTGQPDLAERHREVVLERLRHGR
jgi:metal-responsive CopG/Arc/MetJ family transcriptional regulator